MKLHSEMAASAAEAVRVVCGVSSDQLSATTPCTDWDLRALLNHMILWTAYSAEPRARDELMNKDFVAEPGYAAAYAAQPDKAVAAWADPVAWQRNLNVMGAPRPAARITPAVTTSRPPFSARLRPTPSCSGSTRDSATRSRFRHPRQGSTGPSPSPGATLDGRRERVPARR